MLRPLSGRSNLVPSLECHIRARWRHVLLLLWLLVRKQAAVYRELFEEFVSIYSIVSCTEESAEPLVCWWPLLTVCANPRTPRTCIQLAGVQPPWLTITYALCTPPWAQRLRLLLWLLCRPANRCATKCFRAERLTACTDSSATSKPR